MRDVPIREGTIRLGQLLKLAGVAGSGSDAKALLAEGLVRVNGELEERRGRQLHDGDVVEAEGEALRVVAPEA
jgi:ribosome-associated protein